MSINDLKETIKNKIANNTFFKSRFGFESGIDITDDNQVQYRKNVVIKNIIFVSNLIYTLIFTLISFGDPSNWLLTILLFPVTFFVNYTLKKLMNRGANDKMSQTIAMYFASFYMFVSSLIIYIKLKNGSVEYLKECGYILLYYSLAICAFYQNKKMLKNISVWAVIGISIVHFTITYPILSDAAGMDVITFFKTNVDVIKDIIIRTLLLIMFLVVLYIYVTMANYMQDERKKELVKRRQVQEDFTNVVSKIFEVTLADTKVTADEAHEVEILALMVRKLASLLGYSKEECDSMAEYAQIHVKKSVTFNSESFSNEDEKFESLRQQTELGSALISRLQLSRKCEDIIRATFEGSNNDEFIKRMTEIQNNKESQIILICDIYVCMRSYKSYKKAYSHKSTMNYLEEHFNIYFDAVIFDRFIRFSNEFEAIFDNM